MASRLDRNYADARRRSGWDGSLSRTNNRLCGAADLSDYRTTISSEPTRNLCPRLFLVEANVMKPSFFTFLAVAATAAFSNEPPVAITQQSSAVPIQAKATPPPAPAALPTADPDKLIPPSQAKDLAGDVLRQKGTPFNSGGATSFKHRQGLAGHQRRTSNAHRWDCRTGPLCLREITAKQ